MLKLRELRIEREKTQEKIANQLGISRQVYANYENEINQPSLEMLSKIADFFEVSTDYLLGREDDFGVIQTKTPGESYTREERQLVEDYRALAPDLQEMIRATIQTWKGTEANAKKKNVLTVS